MLRLLAATAVAALAVGCAAGKFAQRAEAGPATRSAFVRPALPNALVRLRDALSVAAGSAPVELQGGSRAGQPLLHAVLPARVLFRADTALLIDDGAALLRAWGAVLARDPRVSIEIEGHTDEIGRAAYNLEFSRQRAQAVRDALIAAGVAAERITAEGVGEGRPRTSGRSIAAREDNRRIEIWMRLR